LAVTEDRIFELVAGHPALDLANTLDWRFRPGGQEELLATYGDLLAFVSQARLLTPKQARELTRNTSSRSGELALAGCRELREALADAIYAQLDARRPPAATLKTLERIFHAARERQRLQWDSRSFQWEWPGPETDSELPVWLLANAASELLLSDSMEKVRACDNPECRWLFLDTSKNHTRRWCDMKVCGNRMKARRFKAQHRD
jgi:predicted RNA-binding Zn ribbon-like protein